MAIDCLIIGAGPAGLTAGIYLRRFHREVLIYDAGHSRANLIPLSNNYPGFPEGISGKDLLARLSAQYSRFGGVVAGMHVEHLTQTAEKEFVAEAGGQTIRARNVLLATGIVDTDPALAGFSQLKDQGLIRYCPICDGYEFTDHRIGIIGTDEHGVRESEFISNYSNNLAFITLQSHSNLDNDQVKRLNDKRVRLISGEARQVYREPGGTGAICLEMVDNTIHTFDVLYCALGARVQSDLALDLGAECDEQTGLLVNAHLQTSIPGLYAAGDVVSGLSQLAVAIGQAAIAATAIHNKLGGGHNS